MEQAAEREPSPFEVALVMIESSLNSNFLPRRGANTAQNLAALRQLEKLSKIGLEGFVSSVAIISLNDVDYERLKNKIKDLIYENEHARRENGLE